MTEHPGEHPTGQPPTPPMPEARLRTPRQLAFPQLLGRLADTAAERAAAAQDADQQQKLERVARLARELAEALSEVEVSRDRRPDIG